MPASNDRYVLNWTGRGSNCAGLLLPLDDTTSCLLEIGSDNVGAAVDLLAGDVLFVRDPGRLESVERRISEGKGEEDLPSKLGRVEVPAGREG